MADERGWRQVLADMASALAGNRSMAAMPLGAPKAAVTTPAAQAPVSTDPYTQMAAGGIPPRVGAYGISPEDEREYKTLLNKYQTLQTGALADQQSYADDLQTEFDAARSKSGRSLSDVDFSPVMSLIDTWTGSNMAQSYRPPTSQKVKQAELQSMRDALRKARGDVSSSELQMLKDRLGAYEDMLRIKSFDAAAQLKAKTAKEGSGRTGDRQEQKISLGAKKDYRNQVGITINGLGQLMSGLYSAKDIIERNGGIPRPGTPDAGLFKAAISTMIVADNKYLAGLGALAGGDLDILKSKIGAGPDAVQEWLVEKFKGGPDTYLTVFKNIEEESDRLVNNFKEQTSLDYEGLADENYNADFRNYMAAKKKRITVQQKQTQQPKSVKDMTDAEVEALYQKKIDAEKAAQQSLEKAP